MIGVSIAVPDPMGSRLQDYRVGLGDEAARGIPTHITLVSPYDVGGNDLAAISEHLGTVAVQHLPFDVHLRGTGTFRPTSPVVFVGVVEGISGCEQLAAGLRTGPLSVTSEFPYHPHVTVAHHLDDPAMDRAFDELSGYDARFTVDEFWLYLNDARTGWQPVEAHRLGTER